MLMKLCIVVVCVLTALPCAAAAPSYERDITPILRTYCSGCHNDREQEGEFSVETFASLRKGGAGSGDPVVPGDAAASVMIQRIHSQDGDHMPPDDEPQVPSAELALLTLPAVRESPMPVEAKTSKMTAMSARMPTTNISAAPRRDDTARVPAVPGFFGFGRRLWLLIKLDMVTHFLISPCRSPDGAISSGRCAGDRLINSRRNFRRVPRGTMTSKGR